MQIFQYTSSLDQVNLLAGTKYWISVLNKYPPVDIGDRCVWQASNFDPADYVALRNSDGATPSWAKWRLVTDLSDPSNNARNSMAFNLYGMEVSIPPALYPFGTGPIGLVGFARRTAAPKVIETWRSI